LERRLRNAVRHGQIDANCIECLEVASNMVAKLGEWESTLRTGKWVFGAFNLRVSCQAALEGKRVCSLVGYERSNDQLGVEIEFGQQGIEDLIEKYRRDTGGVD